jgi:hypothetical protein
VADAALSFFSWIRRGLSTAINTSPLQTNSFAGITLGFNDDTDLVVKPNIPLIGPGDIVGIDANVVVRTWPKPNELDAEFVSYALIEFDQADLAWRYSPEPASDQLKPWLTLVVLAGDEYSLAPATAEQPIAVLTVKDVNDLPSPSESWAFSHTQIAGAAPDVAGAIVGQPGVFTGRVISPRLLTSGKDYIACLVPTFERGRLADAGAPSWPEPQRGAFIADLAGLLNIPSEGKEAELVPPLYGQWYAADDQLDAAQPSGSNPAWFFDLNSDPRNRVAAALGTKVIQNEQQALLASGWDQVGDVRAINDAARVLQLSRNVLSRIWQRHFVTASQQRFYQLTFQLHAYVTCGSDTVCANVAASPILPGFMSTQWLRWTRPRGPIGLLQGRPALDGFVPNLLEQLNDCRRPATDPGTPPGTHFPHNPRDGLFCETIEVMIGLGSTVTLFWGLLLLWVVRKLLVTQSGDCWWLALRALRFAMILIRVAISVEDARRRCRITAGTVTVNDVLNGPKLNGFTMPALRLPLALPLPPIPSGTTDSPDAAALRDALQKMLTAMQLPAREQCAPGMDLPGCQSALVTSLDPVLTVGQVYLENRQVNFAWSPLDPLEPLFLAPEYERPMYEPLSRVSFDWILPGLNGMARDAIGLAVTNQRFIEGYMVGLNHEMTRELLWNEFPTDQRGTYFRQFWDIAGHIKSDGSKYPPDQLRDINPIAAWPANAALGDNNPRPRPHGDDEAQFLVLVVRAQLIQKYPNVIVYAQRRDASGTLTGAQTHPVFYALLEPDIAFYGFELTPDDVRNDPSLYFVLQEQPGEPKFADEATNRDANKYTSTPEAIAASAGLFAQNTFLQPFRLGIQGSVLLPPPSTP